MKDELLTKGNAMKAELMDMDRVLAIQLPKKSKSKFAPELDYVDVLLDVVKISTTWGGPLQKHINASAKRWIKSYQAKIAKERAALQKQYDKL